MNLVSLQFNPNYINIYKYITYLKYLNIHVNMPWVLFWVHFIVRHQHTVSWEKHGKLACTWVKKKWPNMLNPAFGFKKFHLHCGTSQHRNIWCRKCACLPLLKSSPRKQDHFLSCCSVRTSDLQRFHSTNLIDFLCSLYNQTSWLDFKWGYISEYNLLWP